VVSAGVVALALACAPAPDAGDPSAATPADRALALHRDAIVVDGHSDTTPWFGDPEWDFAARHAIGHEDLPRMREGGLDAQIWSIYFSKEEAGEDPVPKVLERMQLVHALAMRFPRDLGVAFTAAEVRRIVGEGRIACLMGLEGGHLIADDLANLATYQRLGARYLTLTHSFHTSWADSSGTNEAPAPLHGGLTPVGEEVVRELNRLGILVDVSHVSDDAVRDALRASRAPVIASHSSVRAIADHPRNLSDPMLRALAENGGVAMLNFYSGYVDAELVDPLRDLFVPLLPRITEIRTRWADDPVRLRREQRALFGGLDVPRTSLETLLDHFDHAIRVAGPEHVGIGADWDGVASMPRGLGDVSELPNLTRGLLARGHAREPVRGVLGENFLRALARAEDVARRMQAESE
jgi:membrane dipeptidase